jgi:hypothetical protein
MLSDLMLGVDFVECNYNVSEHAQCRYAECRCTKCHGANSAQMLNT